MKILALHGFSGSGADFHPLAKSDPTKSLWWTPDMPGHGYNTQPATLKAVFNELDIIAKQINEPFLLIGYSMGGRLALQYAVKRAEIIKGIILIGTTPGIIDHNERQQRQERDHKLATRIESIGVPAFIEEWLNTPLIKTQKNIPDNIRSPMRERRNMLNPRALANNLRGLGTGSLEAVWSKLGKISCPVLVLAGEKDQKFVQIGKEMAKALPNAEYCSVPCTGHCAHLENTPFFLAQLENMIEKLAFEARM